MSRNFLKEFQRKIKTVAKPVMHEEPVVVSVEKGTEDTFSVVRCTLPKSVEIPVFLNCSLHQAKDLVFRVLKARVIEHNGVQHAEYFDWVKEAV